jgi:hypothetical protein
MTTITNLTEKEQIILKEVCSLQIEDGLSEFTSVRNASEKGILGSLVKKELIYNCHEGESFYMYCLTTEGLELCKELGFNTEHIHFFN